MYEIPPKEISKATSGAPAYRGDLPRPGRAPALLLRAVCVPLRLDDSHHGVNALILSTWHSLAGGTTTTGLAGGGDSQQCLVRELRDDNERWHRSWQQDGTPRARHAALAADLAALVDAFTRLAEASGQARWIGHARSAAEQLLDHFWDAQNGGLFTTADDGEQLIVRQKDLTDNATPSANSTAALALYRLAALTGVKRYEHIADQILQLFSGIIQGAPSAFGNLLAAVHLRHVGTTEIVIAGTRDDLGALVQGQWLPTSVHANPRFAIGRIVRRPSTSVASSRQSPATTEELPQFAAQ